MKQTQSSHRCSFCQPGVEDDLATLPKQANSTNTEIELVIGGKFIVTFPAMILHYLDPNDAKQHGWAAPWKPPMWFVSAILGGAVITAPPTPEEELTLPNYNVGYLTTQQSIEDWYGATPPASYKLNPQAQNKGEIIDTQGGDINFATGVKAEFGSLGSLSEPLMMRLRTLINNSFEENNRQKSRPNSRPSLGIVLNDKGQIVSQGVATKDLKSELPPAKKVIIPFASYIRHYLHSPYREKHKEWFESRKFIELTSLPVITNEMTAAENKAAKDEADSKRKIMFGFERYHLVGALIWSPHEKAGTAEAKIDFDTLEDSNSLMKFNDWEFDQWKGMLLDVFKELIEQLKLNVELLKLITITKDKIIVPLALLKALKGHDPAGNEIEIGINYSPSVVPALAATTAAAPAYEKKEDNTVPVSAAGLFKSPPTEPQSAPKPNPMAEMKKTEEEPPKLAG